MQEINSAHGLVRRKHQRLKKNNNQSSSQSVPKGGLLRSSISFSWQIRNNKDKASGTWLPSLNEDHDVTLGQACRRQREETTHSWTYFKKKNHLFWGFFLAVSNNFSNHDQLFPPLCLLCPITTNFLKEKQKSPIISHTRECMSTLEVENSPQGDFSLTLSLTFSHFICIKLDASKCFLLQSSPQILELHITWVSSKGPFGHS